MSLIPATILTGFLGSGKTTLLKRVLTEAHGQKIAVIDDEIAESYLLDSILTLVDAKHADQQLDSRQEARRQIGFADQIFISKTDLVDDQTVEALIHRVKHMNPRAPQTRVNFGDVPISQVFDLKGFNLNAKLEIDPEFLKADEHDHDHDH